MTAFDCSWDGCPPSFPDRSSCASSNRMQNQRIAIIGGGPGGLMTAYRLEQRITSPCEITLYEASSRLGGKVVTNRFRSAPVSYEAGAAELYDYTQLGPDPLRELVAEL